MNVKHKPIEAPLQASPDVFDQERIERLGKGNHRRLQLLADTIAGINSSAATKIEAAKTAYLSDQHKEACGILHGLKGVVGNYGGQLFMQALADLEGAIKQQQQASIVEQAFEQVHKCRQAYESLSGTWCRQQKLADQEPSGLEQLPDFSELVVPSDLHRTLVRAATLNNVTLFEQKLDELAKLNRRGELLAQVLSSWMDKLNSEKVLQLLLGVKSERL